MLKIGVTAGFLHPDKARGVFWPKRLNFMENELACFLAQAGVMPVLVPDLERADLVSFVKELDGVVFQGGHDMAPVSYHEVPIDIDKWPGDAYRDHFELSVAEIAWGENLPMLGICRGCQLLNVFFGGTLYQDIETQTDSKIIHRNSEQYDALTHRISCVQGGLLSNIYANMTSMTVNSIHHQVIAELAKPLRAEAHSEDGLVEAFTHTDKSQALVMGVQWHPEFEKTARAEQVSSTPLLSYFINEIKRIKNGNCESSNT